MNFFRSMQPPLQNRLDHDYSRPSSVSLNETQLGGRPLSSPTSQKKFNHTNFKFFFGQNIQKCPDKDDLSARKQSKGLIMKTTSKKQEGKKSEHEQGQYRFREHKKGQLSRIELSGQDIPIKGHHLFEFERSEHKFKINSQSYKKQGCPFEPFIQIEQPKTIEQVETTQNSPKNQSLAHSPWHKEIEQVQLQITILRQQLHQQQMKCQALQMEIKAKDAAQTEADQLTLRLMDKVNSQQNHIEMLKSHTLRLQFALRDAYVENDKMKQTETIKHKELEQLKEKAAQFQQTATNIQKQLQNVYAYLEQFQIKNQETLQKATKDINAIELFEKKEDELKAKNNNLCLLNAQMEYKINKLQLQLEQLRHQKEQLERKQEEEANSMKEKLDDMQSWFNTVANDDQMQEQIKGQSIMDDHEQQESTFVSRLKRQVQFHIDQNQKMKFRYENLLQKTRQQKESQLKTANKEIARYYDKVAKLMAELKKGKSKKGPRKAFDVIQEENEEDV